MPLYEFRCRACGTQFEALAPAGGSEACPNCGRADPERVFSSISRPLRFGLRGAAARRSDAKRSAREERRREKRAERQDATS